MTETVPTPPPERSTELAVRAEPAPLTAPALISDAEIDRTFRIAKALAMSGMFKDTRQAEQAFAKILVGRDLGLSPTQSLMGIHMIEGKPELSANVQAAFVKRTPGYDFRVTEHTDEACEIAFYRDGEEVGRSRFTMEDAQRAGLANKGPWKSYPRNMLYARALTNGVAFHVPEVTGGVRVYGEGEISGEFEPEQIVAAPARAIEATVAPEPVTIATAIEEAKAADEPIAEEDDPTTAWAEVELLPDDVQARLLTLITAAKDDAGWDDKRVKMTLVSYGARDSATVESAIATLPAHQVDKAEAWIKESVDDALDAKIAAEAAA